MLPRPQDYIASCLLALACGSCGDSAAAARTPLTVWVLEEGAAGGPLVNATVALDPAGGGERITKTSDAEGRVTFETDFTRGGAAVTVLSNDHVFITMLDVSPETTPTWPDHHGKPVSDLVILPPRLDRVVHGETVELRGTISGKATFNSEVGLATSSLARLGATQTTGTAYSLRAPKNRPFFLLGFESKSAVDDANRIVSRELVRSFRIPLEARGDDQLLDLELTSLPALPVRAVRIRAEVPPSFPAGTRASASIASADSSLTLGVFAAGGRGGGDEAVDLAVIDTDIAPERVVSQVILTAPDGSTATRAELGTMTEGQTWTGFRPLPVVASPDASRTLRDPITLESFPEGGDFVANVYAASQLFWVLRAPPGGLRDKTFRVPYRDEITSADVQLVALSVSARFDRAGDLYRSTSTFRDVILRKR